jgi:hypothetical protein
MNKLEALVAVLPTWKEDLVAKIDVVGRESRLKTETLTMRAQHLDDQHKYHVQVTGGGGVVGGGGNGLGDVAQACWGAGRGCEGRSSVAHQAGGMGGRTEVDTVNGRPHQRHVPTAAVEAMAEVISQWGYHHLHYAGHTGKAGCAVTDRKNTGGGAAAGTAVTPLPVTVSMALAAHMYMQQQAHMPGPLKAWQWPVPPEHDWLADCLCRPLTAWMVLSARSESMTRRPAAGSGSWSIILNVRQGWRSCTGVVGSRGHPVQPGSHLSSKLLPSPPPLLTLRS